MKKIMFNDKYGLTQAVLEGRKTMTRRIVPVQPCGPDARFSVNIGTGLCHWDLPDRSFFPDGGRRFRPPYEANTIVAVAQCYSDIVKQDPGTYETLVGKLHLEDVPGWANKMFVAADLMPHRLRMNSWRLERLQDITDEDCLKEGIEICYGTRWYKAFNTKDGFKAAPTPRAAFAALIDKVSGKGTWASNPYVFVYDFQLVR